MQVKKGGKMKKKSKICVFAVFFVTFLLTLPANTFLGDNAGRNNTGFNNTFIGYFSGYYNSGNSNTFLGEFAGRNNTTGRENTFLGSWTGRYNTTGRENTFLGNSAGRSNTSGSRNIFIGYNAGRNETGSDKLYIANGINSNNVLIYGDFSSRRIGIATTTPSYNFDVNGSIRATGNIVASCGTLTCSDARFKAGVRPISDALDKITNLQGVKFRWKNEKKNNGQHLGVIGQEVEKVFPEVVFTDNNGYKLVAYSNLVAPLIEAVKELKSQNEKAFKSIKELKVENEALKERIEALEKKIKD
jgi:hypothetical protein